MLLIISLTKSIYKWHQEWHQGRKQWERKNPCCKFLCITSFPPFLSESFICIVLIMDAIANLNAGEWGVCVKLTQHVKHVRQHYVMQISWSPTDIEHQFAGVLDDQFVIFRRSIEVKPSLPSPNTQVDWVFRSLEAVRQKRAQNLSFDLTSSPWAMA